MARMEVPGCDYYIGFYYWRYNRDTKRVEVFTRNEKLDKMVWDDSDMFQTLYKNRWNKGYRWVSKDTAMKEAYSSPYAVKDWHVVKFNKSKRIIA